MNVVIHPNDATTDFLSVIYSDKSYIRFNENNSNSSIRRAIINSDKIIMLGHGSCNGLYSKKKQRAFLFDRVIVNSEHVNFLREKTCIGIWCNANMFAKRYKLHGLFSGMIISDIKEAYYWNIETTDEELEKENTKFAERLKFCLEKYPLDKIPNEMSLLDDVQTPLTKFNYSNLYFY